MLRLSLVLLLVGMASSVQATGTTKPSLFEKLIHKKIITGSSAKTLSEWTSNKPLVRRVIQAENAAARLIAKAGNSKTTKDAKSFAASVKKKTPELFNAMVTATQSYVTHIRAVEAYEHKHVDLLSRPLRLALEKQQALQKQPASPTLGAGSAITILEELGVKF